MRKPLIALALTFTIAASFAACGGSDQTAATPTPVATIAPGQAGAPVAPAATSAVTGNLMGPAGKAQDTVNQLNDLQNSYGGDE